MRKEILRMERIGKSFQRVKVLHRMKLNLFQGEVLGLAGLNGSGKTTFINILAGILPKDDGSIFIDEQETGLLTRREASRLGVFCIFLHSKLTPNLSVAENVSIFKRPKYKVIIDKKKMYREAKPLLKLFEVDVDPRLPASQLTIGQQHMVQIANAVSAGVRILVLDGIIDTYSEHDLVKLKKAILTLRSLGISVIFAHHKLDFMMEIADRITIIRDGRHAGTCNKEEYSTERLTALLAGYEFSDVLQASANAAGDEILSFNGVNTELLKNVSFSLYKGEILGFIDLDGLAGVTQVIEVLYGSRRKIKGKITVKGTNVNFRSPKDAIDHGIGFISGAILESAVFPNLSAQENMQLLVLRKVSTKFAYIKKKWLHYLSKPFFEVIATTFPGVSVKLSILDCSKEFQRQILIYRWLMNRTDILILMNLTNGMDVMAKRNIHLLIRKIAKEGTSVIFVSSDVSEIIDLSDRVIVINHGKVTGEISGKETSKEKIRHLF